MFSKNFFWFFFYWSKNPNSVWLLGPCIIWPTTSLVSTLYSKPMSACLPLVPLSPSLAVILVPLDPTHMEIPLPGSPPWLPHTSPLNSLASSTPLTSSKLSSLQESANCSSRPGGSWWESADSRPAVEAYRLFIVQGPPPVRESEQGLKVCLCQPHSSAKSESLSPKAFSNSQ